MCCYCHWERYQAWEWYLLESNSFGMLISLWSWKLGYLQQRNEVKRWEGPKSQKRWENGSRAKTYTSSLCLPWYLQLHANLISGEFQTERNAAQTPPPFIWEADLASRSLWHFDIQCIWQCGAKWIGDDTDGWCRIECCPRCQGFRSIWKMVSLGNRVLWKARQLTRRNFLKSSILKHCQNT